MLTIRRRLQLELPGEPVAGAALPSGDVALLCVRAGDAVLARFDVGTRSEGPRRSERLLRLPSIRGPVQLLLPPTGRDRVVAVAGCTVLGIDAESMEPRWRLNLDADGKGVAALLPTALVVSDPPGKLTKLDWEGHELRSMQLDADVVALCAGPTGVVAVTTRGCVGRWGAELEEVDRIPAPLGPASIAVTRDGAIDILSGEVLYRLGDPTVQVVVEGARALAHTPRGDAVVTTQRGVCILTGTQSRRVGELWPTEQVLALPSGSTVATSTHNLLVLEGDGAQMMAFAQARVLIPTPTAAL